MIPKNKLNWTTTEVNNEQALLLRIMRDLQAYCAKGYCEIQVAVMHFCELPNTLIARLWHKSPAACQQSKHVLIDWADYHSIDKFFRLIIAILCEINHVKVEDANYNSAFSEFWKSIKPKNDGKRTV